MRRPETRLEGPILVEPVVHGDFTGVQESYRRNVFAELGIHDEFVQDNHRARSAGSCAECTSRSAQGWQSVRCSRGAIVDVDVVDLRRAHRLRQVGVLRADRRERISPTA